MRAKTTVQIRGNVDQYMHSMCGDVLKQLIDRISSTLNVISISFADPCKSIFYIHIHIQMRDVIWSMKI